MLDAVGNLLVLDAQADPEGNGSKGALFRVDRFTGRAETLLTSERFVLPNGLCLGADGRIFISEKEHDPENLGKNTGCLLAFDPATKALDVLAAGEAFVAPGAVASAPGGKLYFLDADSNPNDYPGSDGKRGTPGVLFEVDPATGAYRSLIEFKDTVSPVGLIPLPDGGLVIIDANADKLRAGFFLGGIVIADPEKGVYRFAHLSKKFLDPTRGDLGLDGKLYFTDANADPEKHGPDGTKKGVNGTGPGAVWRYDLAADTLECVKTGPPFVNPTALRVVNK